MSSSVAKDLQLQDVDDEFVGNSGDNHAATHGSSSSAGALLSSPKRTGVSGAATVAMVNINPKAPENRQRYRREILDLLQPAMKAYHRSYKEHADKYLKEEKIVKITKKTQLPFDELHVAAAFEAMLCLTPANKHKTLLRQYDIACEVDRVRPRLGVGKLLDKLTRAVLDDHLDQSTAQLRQAVRDIPSFVRGFDTLVERFLDEVVTGIARDAWVQQEERSAATIRQRVADAIYAGGLWA